MKLFINNQLFDSEKDVIVLTLSQEEKAQISEMAETDFSYCTAPEKATTQELEDALKNSKQAVSLFTANTGF